MKKLVSFKTLASWLGLIALVMILCACGNDTPTLPPASPAVNATTASVTTGPATSPGVRATAGPSDLELGTYQSLAEFQPPDSFSQDVQKNFATLLGITPTASPAIRYFTTGDPAAKVGGFYQGQANQAGLTKVGSQSVNFGNLGDLEAVSYGRQNQTRAELFTVLLSKPLTEQNLKSLGVTGLKPGQTLVMTVKISFNKNNA